MIITTEYLVPIVWLDSDLQFGVVELRHPGGIGEYGRSILGARGVI